MEHEIIRSYNELADRILCLPDARTIGMTSSGYPLYSASLTRSGDLPNILISGGIHGREPAGAFAVVRFLEQEAKEPSYPDFNFFSFPCVNPWGFERGIPEKEDGQNINRQFFDGTAAKEVNAIIQALKQETREYLFSMDMHETSPHDEADMPLPMSFYMWEHRRDENQCKLGGRVTDALQKRGFATCEWDTIFGDYNHGGAIFYPEDAHSIVYANASTFEAFLVKTYTKRAFTTETPTTWSMEKRVSAHVLALKTLLQAHRQYR